MCPRFLIKVWEENLHSLTGSSLGIENSYTHHRAPLMSHPVSKVCRCCTSRTSPSNMPWDYHGHWVDENLLIFWLCLVSFIVYAQLSRWVYSFVMVWLVAYFLGPELSTLMWKSLLILGFTSLTVWQHAHVIRAQYDKVCADTATAATRSEILTFVNCAGEEYHYTAATDVKPTGPVALGCRPPLSWS